MNQARFAPRFNRSLTFASTIALLLFVYGSVSTAHELPEDPLGSPAWEYMAGKILGDAPVVFDDRVTVASPRFAEDSLNVPVSISVKGLENIQQIVVFSDLNPIPLVLKFSPKAIEPYLAFRFKAQQTTPVRAAVKTQDGVWHVGGQWVEAAGGGCTTASVGITSGNWTETLGQITANRWSRADQDIERLRLRIMHPMDTGLAPGIPAFHITKLKMTDANDAAVAELELFEPVSENPVLSFNLSSHQYANTAIKIQGRDNNGSFFSAKIEH